MPILKIANSYSQISELTQTQFKELKELLSYTINPQAAYFSGRGRIQKRSLLSKRGEFPTGLLAIVQAYLTSWTEVDTRIRPIKSLEPRSCVLPVSPYPEQVDAVDALIRAERGVCQAVTGFGKSITMALLVAKLGLRTLIVVPNLGLKSQLTETFTKLFGSLNNIVIENIDSTRLTKLTDFDVLILDESHHAAANTYRILNKQSWGKIYYRFCFTATSFRSNEEEQLLMEGVTGGVVYLVSHQLAVSQGYVVPIDAFYFQIPKTTIKGDAQSYPAMYSELIVNNKLRNELLINRLGKLHAFGRSTLCLVREIRHGDILSEGSGFPFANGQDGHSVTLIDAFSKGEIKTLIATTGVCGEGVDTRPAEYIVIAGAGKAKTAFMQNCGRGFRKYPDKESCKIVLFEDLGHPWFRKHFREQKKILREEYGVEPIRLDFQG